MKIKTITELRQEFERMAMSCKFSIKRNGHGEYQGSTFCLWAGYWECAKNNGIIIGDDADYKNSNK